MSIMNSTVYIGHMLENIQIAPLIGVVNVVMAVPIYHRCRRLVCSKGSRRRFTCFFTAVVWVLLLSIGMLISEGADKATG